MKNNSQQSISKPSTYTKAAKSNITSQELVHHAYLRKENHNNG